MDVLYRSQLRPPEPPQGYSIKTFLLPWHRWHRSQFKWPFVRRVKYDFSPAPELSSTSSTDCFSTHGHFFLWKAEADLGFERHNNTNHATQLEYTQVSSRNIQDTRSKLSQKLMTSIPSSLLSVSHYLWHQQGAPPMHSCHISMQMDWSLEENKLDLNLFSLASSENVQELQVQMQKSWKSKLTERWNL